MICHWGAQLSELRLFDLELFWKAAFALPEDLTFLECRSLQEGETLDRWVQNDGNTLQVLKLGQEKQLVGRYRPVSNGFLDHPS